MNRLSDWDVFWRQLHREWRLRVRQPRQMIHSVIFFVMMIVFFPMTLSMSARGLHQVGGSLIWIAALFAVLLTSEGLFQRSYEEGILEQAWVSGYSMTLMMLASLVMHILWVLVPLLCCLPILAGLYGFSAEEIGFLGLSFVCGLPALTGVAMLSAACQAGKVQKTTLMALLLLPLTVPIMIFGSSVVSLSKVSGAAWGVLALLTAFSLLCCMGIPVAVAAILKLRFEE